MDFHEIIANQRKYFNSHETTSVEFRKQQLCNLKKALQQNDDQLTDALFMDLKRGKKYSEILEIMGVLNEIDYMKDNLDDWTKKDYKERTIQYACNEAYTVQQPRGVCLIIAPWNYPLGLVLLPLVSAIAAGNTVVIKPSELAPETSKAILKLMSRTFDPKYVAVVEGGPNETKALLEEKFDLIFYTGSSKIGRVIMEAAAKHLTPVVLELGGKCPTIVCADTNIELAAKRIVWGKWMNCGQTCIAPDYCLVERSVKDKFLKSIEKYLEKFYGENIKMTDDYPRIINRNHFNRLNNLIEATKGKIVLEKESRDPDELYFPPIVVEIEANDVLMQDEIFGPILPILTFENIDEILKLVNHQSRPLALYLFTHNKKTIDLITKNTTSGQLVINDVVIQFIVDTLPFGGIGESGMGRYTGKYGFDTFSHEKAVLTAGFLAEPLFASRYPPLTDSKYRQLKLLTGTRIRIPEREFYNFIKFTIVVFVGLLLGNMLEKFL